MSREGGWARLLSAAGDEVASGRPLALATIVETRGSTYRHVGARLLVRADGTWEGNLSGGCLEGEVVDVATRVMENGQSEVVEFDLTADEEAIWGWGLGCNGAIDVFVEPSQSGVQALELLRRGLDGDESAALVTVLASSVPGLFPAHHALLDSGDAGSALPAVVVDEAMAVLALGRTARRRLRFDEGDVELLVEVIRPRRRLLVCGAGHDAVPMVRSARGLGWEVVVVDDRSSFLAAERFPDATNLVAARPEEAASTAGTRQRTAVVIMSHNFLRDVAYLGSFLRSDVDYIGVLGPGRRLQRLLDHLADRDVHPTAEDHHRIHGPAGLDLGAEGPEEIAWAVCAEILAVDRGRHGGQMSAPGDVIATGRDGYA